MCVLARVMHDLNDPHYYCVVLVSCGEDGITELDSQLACYQTLLEKKWGHDHPPDQKADVR
jgi:hypothetical protein